MPARKYIVAGREFSKVADPNAPREPVPCHIIEVGVGFWRGDRSWEHRAVCGASVHGIPTNYSRVNCTGCRRYIESLRTNENAPRAGANDTPEER